MVPTVKPFLLLLAAVEFIVKNWQAFGCLTTALSVDSYRFQRSAVFHDSNNLDCLPNYEMLYASCCIFFGALLLGLVATIKNHMINAMRQIVQFLTGNARTQEHRSSCDSSCCCFHRCFTLVVDNVHRDRNGAAVIILFPSLLHLVICHIPI